MLLTSEMRLTRTISPQLLPNIFVKQLLKMVSGAISTVTFSVLEKHRYCDFLGSLKIRCSARFSDIPFAILLWVLYPSVVPRAVRTLVDDNFLIVCLVVLLIETLGHMLTIFGTWYTLATVVSFSGHSNGKMGTFLGFIATRPVSLNNCK